MQFLKSTEVNREKWDDCVMNSHNSLIYARAFYLDNIASGWDALIGEDYDWVLPLISRRKFGIRYLYQPPFTQQLGIFWKPRVTVPFSQIIQFLQKHYQFAEISWNYATGMGLDNLKGEVKLATNFVLPLSQTYETISRKYHVDLAKNLKRAEQFKHHYRPCNDFKKAIECYRKYYGMRISHVKKQDYKNFEMICKEADEKKMILTRKVVDSQNELLSIALLLFDGKRLYNIMNTTTEAGRKTEANHFLLHSVIKEFSNSNLIFDFEGSDIAGVKSFYKNFGGVNEPYYFLRFNQLPAFIKLFKR